MADEAVFTEVDFLNILGKADDGDDDIRRGGQGRRGIMPDGTGGQERFRPGAGPGVDMERIARLHQVPGHAAAHDAGPDESDCGKDCLCFHGRMIRGKPFPGK